MRSGSPLFSTILGLLSVLLLPVALVAVWVSAIATSTEVFVDETAPLISTPSVQTALTEGAVNAVSTQVELSDAAERVVVPLVREGAARVVESPQMETVWTASMRALHEEFTAVMEGQEPSGVDDQGRVLLEVPVAVPKLVEALLPFGVTIDSAFAPVVTFPIVYVDDLERARTIYTALDRAGLWAPVVAAGLGALAVVFARRRRREAALVAAGWAIGALALGALLVGMRETLVGEVPDPVARALADAAYGMAQRNLLTEVGVVLAVTVVLLLLLGLLGGRRRAG